MKITEALHVYLLQLEADGRSVHTRRQYQRHVALLVRVVGDVGVGVVTTADVARALVSPVITHDADGAPKRATTVNALRTTLRVWFGWLHNAGMIASNPARLVRRARCGSPPPKALSEDEQRRLLDTLARARGWESERDHALFALMLGSGIRLASALSLTASDFDLDRGDVRLRRAKGDREERAVLPAAVVAHLREFLPTQSALGPVWISRHGLRLSTRQAQRRLTYWMKKAGIEHAASPHALRHSFATNLYSRTHDILLVRDALGHKSIESTLVYARIDRERLRAALA